MNIMLEEYRKRLLSDNDCYEKSYLPKEKQEKLNNKVKEGFSDEENPFKKYYYEEISKDNFKFYEKKPADLTDSEFNLYMSMKMLELSKSMEQKQNTMKNIMSFWLVLTIINLIGSICIAMKISDFFKYLRY